MYLCVCVCLPGIKLTGGIGSKGQGIYCLEVVPGSPASEEGSVQPNDKIIYICGKCTLGMTLEDAVKVCEMAPRKVKLKVLRCVRDGRCMCVCVCVCVRKRDAAEAVCVSACVCVNKILLILLSVVLEMTSL